MRPWLHNDYPASLTHMNDFFISYNKADKAMAIAIRAWLEEAGYSTISQAADFHAGSNFVIEMDKAIKDSRKTLALLSADYLDAPFPQSEWAAAFAKDPTGEDRTLIAS